ncbi:hypothetical protein [Burkholderia vietnamiensis]|uniref:hypothetical protein n=1 Tax=Burkholderia vietnamiensis TaxID=60552 RepID=UPI0012D3D3DF|nr:hypothetical protein [Burkholderia vietnamiensis]
MKILGIPLRRPSYSDITKSAIAATAFLVILTAVSPLLGQTPPAVVKVTWLVVAFWGALSSACGITLTKGWQHWCLFFSVAMAIPIAISALASLVTS